MLDKISHYITYNQLYRINFSRTGHYSGRIVLSGLPTEDLLSKEISPSCGHFKKTASCCSLKEEQRYPPGSGYQRILRK